MSYKIDIGACYRGGGLCCFKVWAPLAHSLRLKLVSSDSRIIDLKKDNFGYWHADVSGVHPAREYMYLTDAGEFPDPASYFQPHGVHGASSVIDHDSYKWDDSGYNPLPLSDFIIYELHVGTFTSFGNFEAITGRLNDLKELGITAVELMPVSQFPGTRNWGYDGVYPFAVQQSYGGPEGLKKFVDACHQNGIAVILDVVYNHLGPEGNYLAQFGPYFTDRYKTFWGQAINFDGPYSYGVRDYFIQNALYWFEKYHIDALRLDAVHSIFDMSSKHILEELSEAAGAFSLENSKKIYLIAESDLGDRRVTAPRNSGGRGMDAQWSDDFHHAIHAFFTGERAGYYADFGGLECIERAYRDGFAYSWQHSEFRKKNHGSLSADIPAERFVVFTQNHDQIGNRFLGERVASLLSLEADKLSAGFLILSPYIPLIFMGQEYGETNPFLYFVSHSDENLLKAVREGRKKEFSSFGWEGQPPDPSGEETFLSSRLDWEKRKHSRHAAMLNYYRELIHLRKSMQVFWRPQKKNVTTWIDEKEKILYVKRASEKETVFIVHNCNSYTVIFNSGDFSGSKIFDSSQPRFAGPGDLAPAGIEPGEEHTINPFAIAVYLGLYTKEK